MDNEWKNIIKKFQIRTDKIKESYRNIREWIFFGIGLAFYWGWYYTQINYSRTILSTIGLLFFFLSAFFLIGFFIPLFTRLIIPILLKILIVILNWLSSLIKHERD